MKGSIYSPAILKAAVALKMSLAMLVVASLGHCFSPSSNIFWLISALLQAISADEINADSIACKLDGGANASQQPCLIKYTVGGSATTVSGVVDIF